MKFTNKTNKKIYLALVFYDYSKTAWVSVGWYSIEPHKYFSRKLPVGQHGYANNIFFYYADTGNEKDGYWGGKESFIIDFKHAFNITNADKGTSLKNGYRVLSKFKKEELGEDRISEISFVDYKSLQ